MKIDQLIKFLFVLVVSANGQRSILLTSTNWMQQSSDSSAYQTPTNKVEEDLFAKVNNIANQQHKSYPPPFEMQ
jgi:hypothetical protein